MTLYELLRRLVYLSSLPEPERNDALKLLDELENMNVLGTMAKATAVQAHVCYPGQYPDHLKCNACKRPLKGR